MSCSARESSPRPLDGDPTEWTFFSQERVHGFALDWGNSPTLTRNFKGAKVKDGEVKGGEGKVKVETPEERERKRREEELPFMDEELSFVHQELSVVRGELSFVHEELSVVREDLPFGEKLSAVHGGSCS